MLQALVKFSLRFRGIVISLAGLVLVYGIYVAAHAKLDVFPNFVPPQVTIQTEAPGLAPEQVESLVTRPVGTARQDQSMSEDWQGPETFRSQSTGSKSL